MAIIRNLRGVFENWTEDYTEELAVGHVRRLLDIVACTTSFGPSKTTGRASPKESGPNENEAGPESEGFESNPKTAKDVGANRGAPNGPKSPRPDGGGGDAAEKGDAAAVLCPPPRLGQFYDFFSFSHLTPPIQCEFFFSFSLCFISSFIFLIFFWKMWSFPFSFQFCECHVKCVFFFFPGSAKYCEDSCRKVILISWQWRTYNLSSRSEHEFYTDNKKYTL